MLVIGLTGGIGAGKTVVAQLFAELDVPIIDADLIAKAVTAPNTAAFFSICDHFKGEALVKDGSLDRTKLRQLIFQNPHERKWLENLLHPIIREEIVKQIKMITAPYCIAVIPLLVEVASFPFIDRILVVDAPKPLQFARLRKRDKATDAEIQAILDAQISQSERLSKAHDVITNDGTLQSLAPQVEKLHKEYLKLSQQIRHT